MHGKRGTRRCSLRALLSAHEPDGGRRGRYPYSERRRRLDASARRHLQTRKDRFDRRWSPSIQDRPMARSTACGDAALGSLTVAPGEFNHGETRNLALRSVDTEFAVLIVQDAFPRRARWLDALVEPARRRPVLGRNLGAPAGARRRQPDYRALLSHWIGARVPHGRPVRSRPAIRRLDPGAATSACAFDNVCSCIRDVGRGAPTRFLRARFAEDIEWARDVLARGLSPRVRARRLSFAFARASAVSYELRRTYVAHQRLQRSFGLATIPSVSALMRAIGSSLPFTSAGGREPRHARARWRAPSGSAVALPLGQYLGNASVREGRSCCGSAASDAHPAIVHGFPPAAVAADRDLQARPGGHPRDRSGGVVFVLTREADPNRPDGDVRRETQKAVSPLTVNEQHVSVSARPSRTPTANPTVLRAGGVCRLGDSRRHRPRPAPDLPLHRSRRVLSGQSVPVVMTLHDYWLLCHRGQLFDLDGSGATGR